MLVSMKEILNKAFREQYAIGQFNINNLEWTKTVLSVAQELNSPVILGVSGGTITHMAGFKTITALTINVMHYLNITVPVVLHLDHGQSYQSCKEAIDAGFSSVMFDGSHLPFEENLAESRRVIEYAHPRNVSVELELGTIAGSEDGIQNSTVIYADPEECIKLCTLAPDAFAPALGSTHGLYKGKAKLGFDEMAYIAKHVNIPLVLHGGTGIKESDMKRAISLGTAKINVNTENMHDWCEAVRNYFQQHENVADPRKVINFGCEAIKDNIRQKIKLFGSDNKSD